MNNHEKYSEFRQSKQHWPLFSFNHNATTRESLEKWQRYYQKVLSTVTYEAYFDLMLLNSIYIIETEDDTKINRWLSFQEQIFPNSGIYGLDLTKHQSCLSDALNVLARMYLNHFERPLDILIEDEPPGQYSNYAAFIGAPYLESPITQGMHEIYKYKPLNALTVASKINTHYQLTRVAWSEEKLEANMQYQIDVKQRLLDYYGLDNITSLITSKEYIQTLFEKDPKLLYRYAQETGKTSALNYYVFCLSRFNQDLTMSDEDLLSTYILWEYFESIQKTMHMEVFDTELEISPFQEQHTFERIHEQLQQKCKQLPFYNVIKLQMDNVTLQNCQNTLKILEDLTKIGPVVSCEFPEV